MMFKSLYASVYLVIAVSAYSVMSPVTMANELSFSGFYDISALSDNTEPRRLDFGGLELGAESIFSDHIAANAALVWDGERADIGVAVIDYYWFDDNIPTRGRIFNDPGFHIQLGRFDLPFGIDYQYFAPPDRLSYSAPLTTDLIQQGGFSGDGVRSYGSWNDMNYAVFWTNSVFEEDGESLGGRVGLVFARTPFRLHTNSRSTLEFGVSVLVDNANSGQTRYNVFALDFNAEYLQWQLKGEVLWLKPRQVSIDDGQSADNEQDEVAFYLMLAKTFPVWSEHELTSYVRFDRWRPDYKTTNDEAGNTYPVVPINRISLGIAWQIHEHVLVKLDYFDTLGTRTFTEDFVTDLAALQLVVLY